MWIKLIFSYYVLLIGLYMQRDTAVTFCIDHLLLVYTFNSHMLNGTISASCHIDHPSVRQDQQHCKVVGLACLSGQSIKYMQYNHLDKVCNMVWTPAHPVQLSTIPWTNEIEKSLDKLYKWESPSEMKGSKLWVLLDEVSFFGFSKLWLPWRVRYGLAWWTMAWLHDLSWHEVQL